MQTTLPFLNNLLADWYQLTLDNALYAISLAVSVWLLTAIFYSLRIGFLNRRNRLNTHAAQQQIQQLQEQIATNTALMEQAKAAAEQEAQRAAALQERISGLGKQLSEGIQTLAANADLAGQSLPAADTLETEGLWQRYSQSVLQLIERLRTEQQAATELQQAYRAEIAKLAEKDFELDSLQARLDRQTQQFAQFELIIEEHKNQLRQQENAEQRLSETLQKHQADLARLAALEQQALAWANSQQQPTHQEQLLNPQEVLMAQQEQTPLVKTAPILPEPALAEVKPQPAQIEIEPVGSTKPAAQETAPNEPPNKALKEPSAHPTGKLRDLFASTVRHVKTLDEKLTGRSNSTPATEQLGQPDELNVEPRAVTAETHSHDSQSGVVDQRQPIDAVKEQGSGTAGKLKNLFVRSKRASSVVPAIVEKPTQATPSETTPPSEQASGNQAATTSGANKKMPIQFKNLFRKFKRN